MYTIKRLADLVGLPVNTVRAWERRYALLSPRRSSSGYRLYSDDDVRVLRGMKALVEQGWAPVEAAHRLRGGAGPGSDLVEAAAAVDATGVTRLLDEHLAVGSFEHCVDTWLMPALDRLGHAWQNGELGIEGEHVVAAAIQRRLSAAFDAAARDEGGRPDVLTGLAAGCRHELGLLAFATCLRRQGVRVVHLGSDLPPEAWERAVTRHEPAAAVLAVPLACDVEPSRDVFRALERHPLRLFVGGAEQAAVSSARVTALGHSIPEAAREVQRHVRELVPLGGVGAR